MFPSPELNRAHTKDWGWDSSQQPLLGVSSRTLLAITHTYVVFKKRGQIYGEDHTLWPLLTSDGYILLPLLDAYHSDTWKLQKGSVIPPPLSASALVLLASFPQASGWSLRGDRMLD